MFFWFCNRFLPPAPRSFSWLCARSSRENDGTKNGARLCGRWIAKKGTLGPCRGKSKQQSRQLVEIREDRFVTLSGSSGLLLFFARLHFYEFLGGHSRRLISGSVVLSPTFVIIFFCN
jgi:hypothetical protein